MGGGVIRAACIFACVTAVAYFAAALAIGSVGLSGGTLVLWPVDGLILGLMLGRLRRRPWLVMVAGLVGALLAFVFVGKQMTLAYSRIGLMAIAMPCAYLLALRVIRDRGIAEPRALLPFMLVCVLVGVPTAFARALLLHVVWGFPLVPLTLTTSTATFTGCALLTPLILLMSSAEPAESRWPRTLSTQLAQWGLIFGFALATAWAFRETRYPVAYLVPVALILIAHVVDFTGIVVLIATATVFAIGFTLCGYGPFAHFQGSMPEKILIIQGFIVTMICGALPLSSLMADNSRLKRSLVTALNEAMAASQAKSTFLATMSHEIRTPLNGVLGMAQVMELDELSPAQRDRIGIVRSSGESLLSLLNDVLDLSKIEAGKLTLETIEFELDHVVQLVLHNNSSFAAVKGLALRSELSDAGGIYVGDPNRIRQIIQNLVSNALKFTEVGGVTVSATYAAGTLDVRVEDTGIGIPADRIHMLFEKFSQADESTTRRFGGTGLGLSICRELARAMGGDISLESVVGAGSTFIFRLPIARLGLAPAQAEMIHSDPIPPTAPDIELRVLVAEDNPTNQIVLKTLMAAAGLTPTIVSDGEQAVAA